MELDLVAAHANGAAAGAMADMLMGPPPDYNGYNDAQLVPIEMDLSIQSLSTKSAVTITSEVTADESSIYVFSSSQKYRLVLDMNLNDVMTDEQRATGLFGGELSLQLHFTHPNKRVVESEEDLQYFLSRVETLVEQESKDPELPNLRLFLHINEFEGVPVTVQDGRLGVVTRIWPCIFSGSKRRTKQEDHENIEFVLTFTSLQGRYPVVASTSATVRVVPKSSYYKQKQRKMPAKAKRTGGKHALPSSASMPATVSYSASSSSSSSSSRPGATRPPSNKHHSSHSRRPVPVSPSPASAGPGLLTGGSPVPVAARPSSSSSSGLGLSLGGEEPPLDLVAQRQLEQLQLQHLQQLQLQELQQKQEQQRAALLLTQHLQLAQSGEPSASTGTAALQLGSDDPKELLRGPLFARPAPKLPARASSAGATTSPLCSPHAAEPKRSRSPLALTGLSRPVLTSRSSAPGSTSLSPLLSSSSTTASSSSPQSLGLLCTPRRSLLASALSPSNTPATGGGLKSPSLSSSSSSPSSLLKRSPQAHAQPGPPSLLLSPAASSGPGSIGSNMLPDDATPSGAKRLRLSV